MTEQSEDEMKRGYRQQTMHDLAKEHGLDPIYVNNLTTEQEAYTRQHDLPLIYVWNEKQGPRGLEFTLSVNGGIVGRTLERYMSRDDPWFSETRGRITKDINEASLHALKSACEITGRSPREVCTFLQKEKSCKTAKCSIPQCNNPATWWKPAGYYEHGWREFANEFFCNEHGKD